MKLGDLLPAERIVIPLPAKTLHDAAEQLMGSFVDTGLATDLAQLMDRVGQTPPREAVTVGHEAFVLHVRAEAVKGVGAALGVTAEPMSLEYDSAKSARIVVVVVAPHAEASSFLLAVSAFARVLGREEVSEAVLTAATPDDVAGIPGLRDAELPEYLRVGDVMKWRPRSVPPDATLREAARILMRQGMTAVPVASDKGEVLGMVTSRDLLRVALPKYLRRIRADDAAEPAETADPETTLVREVMDRSVLCLSEEQTLADVASMMVDKGTERFPVVREGVLVGLLTRADIVRRLFGP